jgi:hypothetical protein
VGEYVVFDREGWGLEVWMGNMRFDLKVRFEEAK